jgi:predicted AAA+ superfamily ATPase
MKLQSVRNYSLFETTLSLTGTTQITPKQPIANRRCSGWYPFHPKLPSVLDALLRVFRVLRKIRRMTDRLNWVVMGSTQDTRIYEPAKVGCSGWYPFHPKPPSVFDGLNQVIPDYGRFR